MYWIGVLVAFVLLSVLGTYMLAVALKADPIDGDPEASLVIAMVSVVGLVVIFALSLFWVALLPVWALVELVAFGARSFGANLPSPTASLVRLAKLGP